MDRRSISGASWKLARPSRRPASLADVSGRLRQGANVDIRALADAQPAWADGAGPSQHGPAARGSSHTCAMVGQCLAIECKRHAGVPPRRRRDNSPEDVNTQPRIDVLTER